MPATVRARQFSLRIVSSAAELLRLVEAHPLVRDTLERIARARAGLSEPPLLLAEERRTSLAAPR